jgi:hypothetical protein
VNTNPDKKLEPQFIHVDYHVHIFQSTQKRGAQQAAGKT